MMLIEDLNKTYSLTIHQDRYGRYREIAPVSDYYLDQYVNNLKLTFRKAIPTDAKIVLKV